MAADFGGFRLGRSERCDAVVVHGSWANKKSAPFRTLMACDPKPHATQPKPTWQIKRPVIEEKRTSTTFPAGTTPTSEGGAAVRNSLIQILPRNLRKGFIFYSLTHHLEGPGVLAATSTSLARRHKFVERNVATAVCIDTPVEETRGPEGHHRLQGRAYKAWSPVRQRTRHPSRTYNVVAARPHEQRDDVVGGYFHPR